jgi:drug/metabolite transporter (DMT)-like permease
MKHETLSKQADFSVGILFVVISALGFSIKSILVKLALSENPNPILILALRMAFSLPFFFAGIYFQKEKLIFERTIYFQILILGILGYYFSSIFDFYGLEYVSAGLERIILFTYPTIVVLLNFFIYRKPFNKKEIIALILTYGGILSIFVGGNFFIDRNKFFGGIWIFMAAVTYAGYLVGSGKLIPLIGASLYTSLAMSIAAISVLVHYSVQFPIYQLFNQSIKIYILSFSMAIFSTVIPVFLLSQGIKRIGSQRSAIISSLGPVSTLYLANIFLGEIVSSSEIVGTIVLISGVLLISTSNKE